MRIFRSFPFLLAVAAQVVLMRSNAVACSCLQRPVSERLASALTVFRGRVVEATPVGANTAAPLVVRYRFDVGRVWKGSIEKSISVSSGTISAACGMTFDVGQEYVIYAHGGSIDSLSTSLCAGNFLTGNETATLEIAELDRIAGVSPPGDGNGAFDASLRYAAGLAIGAITARNDRWESGPEPWQSGVTGEIWGAYHFTPRSFVRARIGYAAIGQPDSASSEIRTVGPDLYHIGIEGGLHLFRDPRSFSPYLILGSIVTMENQVPNGRFSTSPDPSSTTLTVAPSMALGLEYRSAALPILFAEIGAASTFSSTIPLQSFWVLVAGRVGAGWRF